MEHVGLPGDKNLIIRTAIDSEIEGDKNLIIRTAIDSEIETEEEKIKLGDVVDIRLWTTPEDREKGNSFDRTISISTEAKAGREEAAPPVEKVYWNSSDETRSAQCVITLLIVIDRPILVLLNMPG